MREWTKLGSWAVMGSLAALAGGCIIVNDPPRTANRPTPVLPPPTAQPLPLPVATATPVATPGATAPVTVAPPVRPSNAGPEGPHTTVNGKSYVTLRSGTAFGDGTNVAGGWYGLVYFLGNTTTTLPAYDSLTPAGVLFPHGFNIPQTRYSQGFPGIDQTRNEWFGIRYEGNFVVAAVGDYQFRVTSDDGARLSIDGVTVVNGDGTHTTRDATGHLQLAPGTHSFRLDYFQASTDVALQVHVTGPTGPEKLFAPAI